MLLEEYDKYLPLLVIDVWEHAYFVEFLDKKKNYLQEIWELVDWQKVESRLQSAKLNRRV